MEAIIIFKKTILALSFSFLLLTLSYCPTVHAEQLENKISILVRDENKDESSDYPSRVNQAMITLNSSENLLFSSMGIGLGLAWLLMFIKGNTSLIGIGILSMLTARWQHYGHDNGYLPTNDTEPFTAEGLFVFLLLEFAVLTCASHFLNRSRTTVMLAFVFHMWVEKGYRMGYIDI